MRLKSTIILAIISLAFTAKLYAQALIDSQPRYAVKKEIKTYANGESVIMWNLKDDTGQALMSLHQRNPEENIYFVVRRPWRQPRLNNKPDPSYDPKYGLIDTTGNVVIPFNWAFIQKDNFGLFRVKTDTRVSSHEESIFFPYGDGKTGLINIKNEIVIPLEYTYIDWFRYGKLAVFSTTGKYTGQGDWYKEKPKSDRQKRKDSIVNGRYFDKVDRGEMLRTDWKPYKNAKFGLIDYQSNVVVPEIYDNIEPAFSSEPLIFYIAKLDGKFGAIDKSGTIIVPIIYNNHLLVRYLAMDYYEKANEQDAITTVTE